MWGPALNEAKVYPRDQICRGWLTCEWLEMTHKVRSHNDRPSRGCSGEVWPTDQLFQHSSCLPLFFPPNIPVFLCLVMQNSTDRSCHVNPDLIESSRKIMCNPQTFQNNLDIVSWTSFMWAEQWMFSYWSQEGHPPHLWVWIFCFSIIMTFLRHPANILAYVICSPCFALFVTSPAITFYTHTLVHTQSRISRQPSYFLPWDSIKFY